MAMQTIRADIYEALFNSTVTVYPQSPVDSLGDSTDQTPYTYNGYLYESAEKIVNYTGEEDVSNIQIYLRGSEASLIDIHSLISCGSAVKQRILTRKLYRGRNASLVIGVLYLP